MATRLSITIATNMEQQAVLGERVEAFLIGQNVDAALRNKLLLVLDDLVTNVITHAYDSDAADPFVRVELALENGGISLDIVDAGRAFDPLALPEPDVTLNLEDRPIGGLGILLVKRIMDRVAYDRRDGINHLALFMALS